MSRYLVIGPRMSGKTTLAQFLLTHKLVDHVPVDDENITPIPAGPALVIRQSRRVSPSDLKTFDRVFVTRVTPTIRQLIPHVGKVPWKSYWDSQDNRIHGFSDCHEPLQTSARAVPFAPLAMQKDEKCPLRAVCSGCSGRTPVGHLPCRECEGSWGSHSEQCEGLSAATNARASSLEKITRKKRKGV